MRTKHGDGFILGAKTPDFGKTPRVAEEQYYYVMIKGETYELSKEAVYSDLDPENGENSQAQQKIEEISKCQQMEAQKLEGEDDQKEDGKGQGVGSMFKRMFTSK